MAPTAPEIKCNICDCNFSKHYNLKRHMLRIHGIEEDIDITQNIYPTNSKYIPKNSENIPKNSKYISKNSKYISNEIITDDNRNKCLKCNKTFTRQWNLKRHETECKGVNEVCVCEYCNTKFSFVSSKYRHYKICKTKKEVDSKALITLPSGQAAPTNISNQTADTINNINTQNNIQTQNNQNIIVVYNPSGTDFTKEHINHDAFIKRILQMVQPNADRNIVLDYGREIFTNPVNQCIKKEDLKCGHSEVHVGDNKWELKLDKALYPKLASDLANNLSEVVYTNRNNIPKRWFDKIVNFLDYMADDGYINTDNRDEKRRIEQEYNMLAKELRLIMYEFSRNTE